MSREAFQHLVYAARREASCVMRDLDDAHDFRQTPNGGDGLTEALARLGNLRRDIETAQAYAKRHGYEPRIQRAPRPA